MIDFFVSLSILSNIFKLFPPFFVCWLNVIQPKYRIALC
uniref:Uncharacterized protein n=1 Tax=Myoviridae sp. ctNQr16 TaxID=2826644 RepID=A0A8S5MAL0_9CAUD|nr:MAG TPA: hypothetical protein [Myoviridae sp. ctNQr16]DAM30484.1 MAG TPA: hypothetical protein [Caudoviricetes sp.]